MHKLRQRQAVKSVCVFLFVTVFSCHPVLALTFKSDGSVVQKSGAVVSKSYAERFKEQFANPDITEWAFADGKEENPQGYFGNGVFLPGTPLLRITKIQQGDDYLAALAEKNGFADKTALQRFIISSASPAFLEELELEEEQAISYVAAGAAVAQNLGADYAKMVDELQTVALEVAAVVQEQVESQVQAQVAEQVEDSVGESVSDAVGESVGTAVAEAVTEAVTTAVDEAVSDLVQQAIDKAMDQWIVDTIKEWEEAGYTNITYTDGSVSGTCPSTGC